VGKRFVAKHWFRAMVEASESDLSQIYRQIHPDVLVVTPKKQHKIDKFREVERWLGFFPYKLKSKVLIIEEADRMPPIVSNFMLKMLEEPPEYVTIILLVSKMDSLLDTVISRCSVVPFFPLTEVEVFEILKKREFGESDDQRTLAAAMSDGIPGEAVRFLRVGNEDVRKRLVKFLHTFKSDSVHNQFQLVRGLAMEKSDLVEVLKAFTLGVVGSLTGNENVFVIDVKASFPRVNDVEFLMWCVRKLEDLFAQLSRDVNIDFLMKKLVFGISERVRQ